MPGTRLTRPDRQAIARGLRAGLDYAEIARSLGRPTSTVSREIHRNGGPAGYRADAAELATRRRAGRRRPAFGPARRTPGRAERSISDVMRRFEQQFAATLIDIGMPPMPARMLAALSTTDEGSSTAAELALHLRASSASVSKAVAYLEDQSMIHRTRIPQQRAELYVVSPDSWYHALIASADRNRRLAKIAAGGAALSGRDTPTARRLSAMSTFHQLLTDEIVSQANAWRYLLVADQ